LEDAILIALRVLVVIVGGFMENLWKFLWLFFMDS